ncbi:INO80 complex, subunit Ies4 [Dactylonectria macrodidyma]|uniref:INO80 complex, subunit Ies4 n=1 Tax=Dactylonectria macrodidyma TaxID=307937 RepID=A0A9P9EY32_9HYPO|nr:INO80 complex, subunit Ies4 [Dactylonectria macrodidyma]
MAPPAKSTDGRRKSTSKSGLLITLNISPAKLRQVFGLPEPEPVKEETPEKDVKESIDSPVPDASTTQPTASASNGDNASDSNAATPAAEGTNGDGTPTPSAMGPPAEGPKKKGVKRSAANANGTIDGIPKPRGKPGPKKKPRLEDGTIDHTSAANRGGAGHKLGPKANQGAINAGLRALDRSGKPCRKWSKGGFTLKSFTGVVWEIPRWAAPQNVSVGSGTEDSTAPSAESSSKENKENGQEGNSASASNSNVAGDVEMQSAPSINASSPAPLAITAAS